MWECVFAALTWCHCVYVFLSAALHCSFLFGASRDLSVTTGAENNWHFSLWASQLWAQRISTALWWHIIFSPFLSRHLSHSPTQISALLPFQNLPLLCLLISHSAAPPRACSVATAGAWTSSARPCPPMPARMVLYHAMGSEGWVCPIALSLEEEEKLEEEEEVVEEQEHRERGWL